MTHAEVETFLSAPRTAVLSTLSSDGGPHSAGMWFAPLDGEIWMWTYAKSQKAVNLRRDPRAALLIEDGQSYLELRGVLVRGRVRLVSDLDALERIGRALYERYTRPRTGIAVEDGPLVEIERQVPKRVGIVLPLTEVASWDHAKL